MGSSQCVAGGPAHTVTAQGIVFLCFLPLVVNAAAMYFPGLETG